MNSKKQTQSKPILPAMAGKIALPVRHSLPVLRSFSEGGSDGGSAAEGPVAINLTSFFTAIKPLKSQ
jgi:hypothetical protein